MLPDFKFIRNAVCYENKLYFVSGNYDDLMEIDVEDHWKMRSVCRFPWKPQKGAVDCILDGTKIWCVAMEGVQIASYDFLDDRIEYYSVDDDTRENISAAYCDGILWIFPRNLPASLVGFSVADQTFFTDESLEAFCISNWIRGPIMISSVNSDDVIMVLKHTKKLLWFNLADHSMQLYKLPIAENLYGVVLIGEDLYLTVEGAKKIYMISPHFEDIQEYKCIDSEEGQYYRPINIDDKLLLCDGHKLCIFENDDFKALDMNLAESSERSFFFSALRAGGKYYFLPWRAERALETDLNFENAKTYKLSCSGKLLEQWIKNTQIIRENDISLQEFLTAVSDNMNADKREKRAEWTTIGEKIYRACIE